MMKLEYIIKNKVGSSTRDGIIVNDIDIRIFFLNPEKKINFKTLGYKTNDDYDYWELELALTEILYGKGNVFLYNTIISPQLDSPSECGKKLIHNRKKLFGKNLIDAGLEYIKKKKYLASNVDEKYKSNFPNKQIYYACSDIKELISNIKDEIQYPFKLEKEIIEIKNNEISLEESLIILDEIEKELIDLDITSLPDFQWCELFIEECYDYYHKANYLF